MKRVPTGEFPQGLHFRGALRLATAANAEPGGPAGYEPYFTGTK
jgi:hypothetical protein